jgi:hypothetical protein
MLEGTGLLDLETRQWDKKAVGSVDESLLQVLPPLIQPHEAAGSAHTHMREREREREGEYWFIQIINHGMRVMFFLIYIYMCV